METCAKGGANVALLNWDTGELAFEGMCLAANMPAAALDGRLRGVQQALWRSGVLKVSGGSLCAVGSVEDGALRRVTLEVCETGGKADPGAEKQRAFLFARLGIKDPCPDTLSGVRLERPFGEVLLCTDHHTGRAVAIVCYAPAA